MDSTVRIKATAVLEATIPELGLQLKVTKLPLGQVRNSPSLFGGLYNVVPSTIHYPPTVNRNSHHPRYTRLRWAHYHQRINWHSPNISRVVAVRQVLRVAKVPRADGTLLCICNFNLNPNPDSDLDPDPDPKEPPTRSSKS